jgi:hypothetical protein
VVADGETDTPVALLVGCPVWLKAVSPLSLQLFALVPVLDQVRFEELKRSMGEALAFKVTLGAGFTVTWAE